TQNKILVGEWHALRVSYSTCLFLSRRPFCPSCTDSTLERRLRHLRSIAARNIVNKNGSHLLDTYFSLHLCDDTKVFKAFYTSEIVKDSLNPTWRSLDFGLMPDRLDTSVSCFLVRIWGGKKGQYHLVIEWKVNLDGLKYLGQQVKSTLSINLE
ncbi:UV radiation resistance-associated protein-like, partial [Cetorhinus maximus]